MRRELESSEDWGRGRWDGKNGERRTRVSSRSWRWSTGSHVLSGPRFHHEPCLCKITLNNQLFSAVLHLPLLHNYAEIKSFTNRKLDLIVSLSLWLIFQCKPQPSIVTPFLSLYSSRGNLRRNIIEKKNAHTKHPPARLTHCWTFGCFDRSLQLKAFHFISAKAPPHTFFFNALCLSPQMDSSKKIKSSPI